MRWGSLIVIGMNFRGRTDRSKWMLDFDPLNSWVSLWAFEALRSFVSTGCRDFTPAVGQCPHASNGTGVLPPLPIAQTLALPVRSALT
jgi:hypothetical protein